MPVVREPTSANPEDLPAFVIDVMVEVKLCLLEDNDIAEVGHRRRNVDAACALNTLPLAKRDPAKMPLR